MNINFNFAQKYNNLCSPNFTAIPLAQYGYLHDKKQNVVVYQLEKQDVNYLQNISDNIDSFYKKHEITDDSTKQVLKEAVEAGIEILQSKYEKKAKVLLALSDDEPSAILIGNVLKVDKNGGFHYSSRKNHSKGETELDWLATWNKKIFGEGKVIVTEFFHSVLKDGFKHIYVRSEVPEKSFALDFYKKMGFEPLSEEQREIQRKNDNRYLIGDYDSLEDNIIPMKITTRAVKNSIKQRSDELDRKEYKDHISICLPDCNL